MSDEIPSYEEIEARLSEAKAVLAALRSGVVDAIIGDQHVLLLRVKEVEERLEHLSLVLRAIRSVNQLIVREKDRDRLIQGACDSLIETRGYHHAWIALIDESGGLVTTAEAGLGEQFSTLVERMERGELPECGRRALKQLGVVAIEDPPSTCADCPLWQAQDRLLAANYAARGAIAALLEHGGTVYGLLTVSLPRDLVADEEEQSLFEEVAADIAFALRSIALEEERKRAEVELRKYSERLEEMVEEQTKELRDAQEQLVRKEKLSILGQLAGGVGHELRNPLAAIKNAAYFLNMAVEQIDPEVKETLDILEREVGTSERIISSLLDFARTQPPLRQKVDLNQVVHEAVSRNTIPENIEVVSQLGESPPTILADPDQLGQVFGNIILNAVQAMPEGGRLTVKTEPRGDPGGRPEWVAVSFTDTGVGIPEENLDKLFEPLFTTKAKGIGLGLALVKTLVEVHEGSIEVRSEVSKGSTFTVSLPIY